MGLDACIMCIGPFKKELIEYLDYPEDYYLGTEKGAVVTTTLFTCNTSDQSRQLANAFGFEAWDFNNHHIKSVEQADFEALYELEERCAEWDMSDFETLRILLENGFFALYMPNG